jgi:hypothetical protein
VPCYSPSRAVGLRSDYSLYVAGRENDIQRSKLVPGAAASFGPLDYFCKSSSLFLFMNLKLRIAFLFPGADGAY